MKRFVLTLLFVIPCWIFGNSWTIDEPALVQFIVGLEKSLDASNKIENLIGDFFVKDFRQRYRRNPRTSPYQCFTASQAMTDKKAKLALNYYLAFLNYHYLALKLGILLNSSESDRVISEKVKKLLEALAIEIGKLPAGVLPDDSTLYTMKELSENTRILKRASRKIRRTLEPLRVCPRMDELARMIDAPYEKRVYSPSERTYETEYLGFPSGTIFKEINTPFFSYHLVKEGNAYKILVVYPFAY
ncbi:MAG: hypothetical protein KA419_11580 [Acidobacteria bacterium]|nr:hypothetical protein [Acidobacteriota bacterium]